MNCCRKTVTFALVIGISLFACSGSNLDRSEIAALVYNLDKQPMEQGRRATITGKFSVVKRSAETASVSTIVFDSKGNKHSSTTIPLADPSLRNAEELAYAAYIDTSKKEDFTYEVYITDSRGKQSNKLKGSFRVTDLY